MRILHVIGWLAPRYGGPAVMLPDLCAALANRGQDVEIVTTNADGDDLLPVPLARTLTWAGATTTFHGLSVPTRYLTSWSLLTDLRRRIGGFDVVHIHTLYRFHGVAAAAVARWRNVPYLIQTHGSLDPWLRARRRRAKDLYHLLIEDPIIGAASAVICTSEREAKSIRGLGYSIPVWIIPNGIDTAALRAPAPAEAFPSFGVMDSDRVVTFLGRIAAVKGVPLLVEAFRDVAARVPNTRLIIAGPDDEGIGRGLTATVAEAGLTDRVSFVGPVAGATKRALLQRSDVFVLASATECFGVAVAEAMAVGCPVVVSPEVGIADVVHAAGAGIVVARDPRAIAHAIGTILDDPVRAAAMGEAGRRAVDERFSWPIVAEQMEAMYEAIVGANRQRAGHSIAAAPISTTDQRREPAYRCPSCGGVLASGALHGSSECAACGWTGSSVGAIPVLLRESSMAAHNDLDHGRACGHKIAQAAHFDKPAQEAFEIDRPHGTPRLYHFLLAEKFRRAIAPIRPHLVGASALTVCGGSGMDAEFLARAGALVTTSDLSLGAATRSNARSERYGLGIRSIVADVEHLPFADQSMDLVAVHDGLHHLDDPYQGLSEMARVARRWVVVTEPARASVSRLAVQLGLAVEIEEAGNRVGRLEPSEVAAFLEIHGYVVVQAERYAMYYRHYPGTVFRLLSRPWAFPIIRAGWRFANALIGRWGNKMVVVAERRTRAE